MLTKTVDSKSFQRADDYSPTKNLTMSRLHKLCDLKYQVNVQSEKLTDALEEIKQVKVILTDARRRLDIMKKRDGKIYADDRCHQK